MSVIRPGGPVLEPQLNIVKPGDDTVEWPKVDPSDPFIIKPIPITVQLKPRTVLPEATINFPGVDEFRDFSVKPDREVLLRILRTKAESEPRSAIRPLPEAKIYNPGEKTGPYAVKLAKPAPKPNPKISSKPHTYIYISGEDSERDFRVKPNREEIQRIIRTKAESEQRAATRPLPPAKIVIPGDEVWPYVVKLSPRAPRPNLEFNPETFTYIPSSVKSELPYTLKEESIIYLPIKSTPDGQITVRPW